MSAITSNDHYALFAVFNLPQWIVPLITYHSFSRSIRFTDDYSTKQHISVCSTLPRLLWQERLLLNCKGAETKVSVPLLCHKPTLYDNSFHRPRWGNIPGCNNCHLPRMSTSIVMSSCGNQKKLPSMYRRCQTSSSTQNFQITPWYMQALHNVFFVFLILSFIFMLKHVPKKTLRHACNTLTTLYETG